MVIRCDRCGLLNGSWSTDRPVLGYREMCGRCHDAVRSVLETINKEARELSERNAVLLLGEIINRKPVINRD